MGRPPNITDKEFLDAIKNYPNYNDRQIAKLLNCEKNVIYRKRIRLNIKNSRHIHISNEDFMSLYKQGMSDIDIGKILNASGCSIGRFRNKLNLAANNIPITKNVKFQEQFTQLVSTERSIEKVAKILGIEDTTANNLARKLGLKSNFIKLVEKKMSKSDQQKQWKKGK